MNQESYGNNINFDFNDKLTGAYLVEIFPRLLFDS